MRLVLLFSFLSFFLLLFSVNVDAQQKIAYVDFQDIFENYSETNTAKDSIGHYKKQLDDEYEVRKKALKDRIVEANRIFQGGGCGTPNDLEKFREEIQQEAAAIEKISAENEIKVTEKRQILFQAVKDEIITVIEQIATENGYAQTFDISDLIHINDNGANDITQKVRAKLEM